METLETWDKFLEWRKQFEEGKNRFIFRGQGNAEWNVVSSLARFFLSSKVNSHEWRKRELKMYRHFREKLIERCPSLYENWPAISILSLMQHHGAPTRLIDFTYSPNIALFFALNESWGRKSAIWIVDKEHLSESFGNNENPMYSGPNHEGGYKIAEKSPYVMDFDITNNLSHPRYAAQKGCFLVPGRISKTVDSEIFYEKVIILPGLMLDDAVIEMLLHLKSILFPDFDALAQDAKLNSVIGNSEP